MCVPKERGGAIAEHLEIPSVLPRVSHPLSHGSILFPARYPISRALINEMRERLHPRGCSTWTIFGMNEGALIRHPSPPGGIEDSDFQTEGQVRGKIFFRTMSGCNGILRAPRFFIGDFVAGWIEFREIFKIARCSMALGDFGTLDFVRKLLRSCEYWEDLFWEIEFILRGNWRDCY